MTHQYGTTWDDLELTPPGVAWQMIRALRSSPPGQAVEPGRHAYFVASLEQAEQFFRAAANVGEETRALLLFYGVNQVGRAIRAAYSTDYLGKRSHGITARPTESGAFADCELRDQGSGHFIEVAKAIGAGSLPDGVPVRSLWPLIAALQRFPLPGAHAERLPLSLTLANTQTASDLYANLAVPEDWLEELPEPEVRTTDDYDRYKRNIRRALSWYPTLGDAVFFEVNGHFWLQAQGDGTAQLRLQWPGISIEEQGDHLVRFGVRSGSHVSVFPRVGGSSSALHPFLVWWAVLYAASTYVRYHPEAWARIVDVDLSEEAVSIAYLGEQALRHLPELIHRTLAPPAATPRI